MNFYKHTVILTCLATCSSLYSSQVPMQQATQEQSDRLGRLMILDLELGTDPGTIKRFLAAGANVNAQDGTGETALIQAAVHGYTKIVQILIEADAQPNIKNSDGDTALMFAALYNHADMVKALLAVGANPNITNEDGDTALIFAVGGGPSKSHARIKIIKLLLDAGANPYMVNKEGKSAYSYKHFYPAIKQVFDEFERLHTPQHRKALQDVAEKSMQARWKIAAVPEDISEMVQEMLRPKAQSKLAQDRDEKENV